MEKWDWYMKMLRTASSATKSYQLLPSTCRSHHWGLLMEGSSSIILSKYLKVTGKKKQWQLLIQAFWNAREETPCRSLTNPKKLSFPSECLIQSWSTTWTGTDGLSPSSWNMSNMKSLVPLYMWWRIILNATDQESH